MERELKLFACVARRWLCCAVLCSLAVLWLCWEYTDPTRYATRLMSYSTAVSDTTLPSQRSPTFLTIFSNHLLIDTVLSLVPKIGLVFLLHDLTTDLCFTSQFNTSFWLPSTNSPLHGPGRVIQTSIPEETLHESIKARRHCQAGVLIAQIALFTVLSLWTVAQWGFGLSVRRYAVKLELQNGILTRDNQHMDEEKAFYEEESLADGYHDAVRVMQQWTW